MRSGAPRGHDAQALCVGVDGVTLHAAVRVGAHVRTQLDQQCRFIIGPAPPYERIQIYAP